MSYQEHFNKQIEFIENSSALFDLGKTNESIRIAVSLRVLMHDTNRSTSLLSLMNKKNKMKIVSTVDSPPDGVKKFGFSLTGIQWAGETVIVTPNLHRHNRKTLLSIADWWEEKVFALPNLGVFSRRDFALIAANKDGGAHVDSLPEKFDKIKQGNSGVTIKFGSKIESDFSEVWPCTLRQMAWELLNSEDFIVQSKLT